MSDKKIIKNLFYKQIIAGFFLLASIVAYGFIVHMYKSDNSMKTIDSEYADYQSLKDLKRTILVENKALNRTPVKLKNINCNITEAYIYIDVIVDNNRPLTKSDTVYFLLRHYKPYECVGGHINTDKNRISIPSEINQTIYIYDLSKLSFLPNHTNTEGNKFECFEKNVLDFMNKYNSFIVDAKVNTSRPGGKLNEISIYYDCENPEGYLEFIK